MTWRRSWRSPRSAGCSCSRTAAQAHGARRGDRHAGTFGDAGCFSFYPGKNLGVFGDAGAVITNDRKLAESIRMLRDHGRREGRDHHAVVGFNSRLDGLQARILTVKLAHLDRWTAERRRVAGIYRRRLDAAVLDWVGPGAQKAGTEAHHLFPILVDDRDALGVPGRARGGDWRALPLHRARLRRRTAA